MKKKYYIFCALLSVALWVLAAFYFAQSQSQLKAASMVSAIQQDVNKQQLAVKTLISNKTLMTHLWENRLTEKDFETIAAQEFIIQLYESGHLTFWSKNNFPVTEKRFTTQLIPIQEGNNFFLYQSFGKAIYPNKRISIIIPIYKHYDVSNRYLHSGFHASPLIPESSSISFEKKQGSSLIVSTSKAPLFYVTINTNGIQPLKPDLYLILLVIAALITSVLSVQLVAIYLSRVYSVCAGICFMAFIVVLTRLLIYRLGLPFHLEDLPLFSPQIFASNNFLPSFGHLFLHVMCIYWLLSFIISKKGKLEKIKCNSQKKIKCWTIFSLNIILVFIVGFYLQHLVQIIVFDSDISFDTNTFKATDKFTLWALFIIVIIARSLMLCLQLANIVFQNTIQNAPIKYFVAVIISIFLLVVYYYCFQNKTLNPSFYEAKNWLDIITLILACIFIVLTNKTFSNNLFSGKSLFSLIFLSVYFSIICAAYFKFFIDQKEQNITRIAFAEKLSRQQDTEFELKFHEIETKVKNDTVLQRWAQHSDTISTQEIYNHFKLVSADLYFSKYAQEFYLFNAQGRSLIPNENVSLASLTTLKNNSTATLNPSLFFRIMNSKQGAYLVYMPIVKGAHSTLVGYLAINFKLKQNISQSVFPRLLQNKTEEDTKFDLKYNYAIYINEKLANQSGAYNFEQRLRPIPPYKFTTYIESGDFSELYYKAAPNMVYMVVYENNVPLGVITIFSFLFGIFLLIATVENWVSILTSAWLSSKKIKFIYNSSMSVRVKYFALGFTAISFFIIGLSTVVFLTNRYQATSLLNIERNTANISEAIDEYLQTQKTIVWSSALSDQIHNNEFSFFLSNIAQQQKIDINIFDAHGQLAFSTQDKIYNTGVLDRNMAAHAFYTLRKKKLFSFTQPETVGKLDYTSSYAPIINHENKMIGYLNIPSFYTKQYLDNQIVSLITTLVNIYTMLLLISSIITFLFINTLTKSLRLVADSLRNVNLKNNELIYWPYKDEIGLLVSEYNKMVTTVEKNARSLVLDERQNAWREMAQQVAHEIKNPLTPMKLNIQYLQQAIDTNHPDIINLTKRVSSSIIEQIDNLNYIASEFSNFAKMPESKTERIDLKSMLERIVLLFAGNKNLSITYSFPETIVIVFADKSQMLRIFTNIVQNAVESIATNEQHGIVDIQLLFSADNDAVIIKVKDNGTGIPDEVKDKIFDPYFTTKSSGTGLGLAMTKKIIELWGGSIKFENNVEGGTTFLLTVPVG